MCRLCLNLSKCSVGLSTEIAGKSISTWLNDFNPTNEELPLTTLNQICIFCVDDLKESIDCLALVKETDALIKKREPG